MHTSMSLKNEPSSEPLTPYTLNPTSQTPHPKSQTLNPEPGAAAAGGRVDRSSARARARLSLRSQARALNPLNPRGIHLITRPNQIYYALTSACARLSSIAGESPSTPNLRILVYLVIYDYG